MAVMLEEKEVLDMRTEKQGLLQTFFEMQPPEKNGEDLLTLWEQLYDEDLKSVVLKTETGPSDEDSNPVFPYEKIQGIVNYKGEMNWRWHRIFQNLDQVERRGPMFREGEVLNFKQPNKNPNVVSQRVLIVGGGPVGIRMAIELLMAGHVVTLVEKRRERKNEDGSYHTLGFTNRINRPHMWQFVRNDLSKLNGKQFMSRAAAYPVFTEPETMSVGIDELQVLLMKSALLFGVDFRLGVGYVDAKIKLDEESSAASWDVELSFDAEAAAAHGKSATANSREEFDCLIGCDGPRSTVRSTQAKIFGNIEKRKFMDCVGIVANIRKLTRKRLKELGFEYGQEPGDMNRSKMVFKDFFAKLNKEADADIENMIYYKASFHNYIILVPKRQDLIKHGLSGKVFTFHAGREGASAQMEEDKLKLKTYVRGVLKSAAIPLDDDAENGGFVNVPNDCMAFDFAECWNTKKSLIFNYPPPGYSVADDGEWEGRKLVPLVALAGDSLLEPFWPMGLGLKRGWHAVMDTSYAIDNLFNRLQFCAKRGGDPEHWTWEEHFEALGEQCTANFELCNRLQVTQDITKGEYDTKGGVMLQLKKALADPDMTKNPVKDAEKIPVEVEVDPWTRYSPLEKQLGDDWKLVKGNKLTDFCPKVQRAVIMRDYYEEHRGEQGEIVYFGKEVISINGKEIPPWKQQMPSKKSDRSHGTAKPKSGATGSMATAMGAAGGGAKPKPRNALEAAKAAAGAGGGAGGANMGSMQAQMAAAMQNQLADKVGGTATTKRGASPRPQTKQPPRGGVLDNLQDILKKPKKEQELALSNAQNMMSTLRREIAKYADWEAKLQASLEAEAEAAA